MLFSLSWHAGVLEGIALVGNPNFALVDEAYPYIAKRLLTDDSPRLRAALKYMVYGRQGVFDADRCALQRPQAAGCSSGLGCFCWGAACGVRGGRACLTPTGARCSAGRGPQAAAAGHGVFVFFWGGGAPVRAGREKGRGDGGGGDGLRERASKAAEQGAAA